MALNNLHAILIREARLKIVGDKADSAKAAGRNDEWMELRATKQRLQAEIKEMKRAG